MSKMKNWMMDMEETVDAAVASGCYNIEDVITYCNENLTYVDEDFVKKYFEFIKYEATSFLIKNHMPYMEN